MISHLGIASLIRSIIVDCHHMDFEKDDPRIGHFARLSVSLSVLLHIVYPNRLAGTGLLFSTVFSEFSGVLDESKVLSFFPVLSCLRRSFILSCIILAIYFVDGEKFPHLVA